MSLTVFDPRTGMRVTLALSGTPERERQVRRWVLRELDRLADQPKQPSGAGRGPALRLRTCSIGWRKGPCVLPPVLGRF